MNCNIGKRGSGCNRDKRSVQHDAFWSAVSNNSEQQARDRYRDPYEEWVSTSKRNSDADTDGRADAPWEFHSSAAPVCAKRSSFLLDFHEHR